MHIVSVFELQECTFFSLRLMPYVCSAIGHKLCAQKNTFTIKPKYAAILDYFWSAACRNCSVSSDFKATNVHFLRRQSTLCLCYDKEHKTVQQEIPKCLSSFYAPMELYIASNAVIPKYSERELIIFAIQDVTIGPGETRDVSTGIKLAYKDINTRKARCVIFLPTKKEREYVSTKMLMEHDGFLYVKVQNDTRVTTVCVKRGDRLIKIIKKD